MLVTALLLRGIGLNGFGVVHLAFVFLAMTAPVLGLRAAWRHKTSCRRHSMWLCGVFLVPPLLAAWAWFVGPYTVRLETATVEAPGLRQPISIGVLADLQAEDVGPHERAAVALLMAQKPDVIVVPGDILQAPTSSIDQALVSRFRSLLGQLDAPGGVFVVPGDVDGRVPLESLVPSHVVVLRDQTQVVSLPAGVLQVTGLALNYRSAAAIDALARAEDGASDVNASIVVAHRPGAALSLRQGASTNVVIAGHTHGGQVSLPLIGPPMTLSAVPRSVAAGGLHRLGNGAAVFVSRGVGLERGQAPRIRFGVPPEVNLVTLTPPTS